MKILFFDDAHTFGGAQIAAVNMARYLKEEMGLEVCFTCSAGNEKLLGRLRQINGIEIKVDGYSAVPFFIVTHFLYLWKIPGIVRKMRAAQGDVVIVNMAGLEFGWLYIYAAKILKLRRIFWLHNVFLYVDLIQRGGWRHKMDKVRDRLGRFFSKYIFSELVTVSNAARGILLKRLGLQSGVGVLGNTVYLPSTIPTREKDWKNSVLNGYPAKFVAAVPGRISFGDKGQDRLIASLCELQRRRIALIFIGDGGDLEKLQKDCGEYENVFFMGWQESIAAYMQDVDVVLLPSRCETQGLIAMEAMYLQAPVLTSNIPAFAELVGEEFIADFDDPVKLYEKIEWICGLNKATLSNKYSARLDICCGDQYKSRVAKILEKAIV
jgi:glycosyltransferase involved in cell wall biosynthesis